MFHQHTGRAMRRGAPPLKPPHPKAMFPALGCRLQTPDSGGLSTASRGGSAAPWRPRETPQGMKAVGSGCGVLSPHVGVGKTDNPPLRRKRRVVVMLQERSPKRERKKIREGGRKGELQGKRSPTDLPGPRRASAQRAAGFWI